MQPPKPPTVAEIAKALGMTAAAVRSAARRYRKSVLGR